jgi:hypothetical protein
MDTTPQNEVHAMTGLCPGDYFIHEFDFDGQSFFAYGLLRSIGGTKYRHRYLYIPGTGYDISSLKHPP